jgi:hypothetical protein
MMAARTLSNLGPRVSSALRKEEEDYDVNMAHPVVVSPDPKDESQPGSDIDTY